MNKKKENGMTLVELMIAMVVVAIGFGGTTILLTGTIASNNKNNTDTTATLLAQMVMEQISSVNPYSSVTDIPITDCAGNSWTISTVPGATGTGNGASLKSDGTIDFTQSQTTLLNSDYAMNYVACSTAGGTQVTYDVRWNVMSISSNSSSNFITTAARPAASSVSQLGGAFFAIPVTLQGIGGAGAGQ